MDMQGCRFVPCTFSEIKPRYLWYLSIQILVKPGFGSLIQGQIYNPDMALELSACFHHLCQVTACGDGMSEAEMGGPSMTLCVLEPPSSLSKTLLRP